MYIFDDLAKERIREMVISTMTPISVVSGEGRFNLRCHENSVHEALNKNEDKIAMCFCLGKNDSIFIHFINIDKDGNYIDNTLGRWSVIYDYYIADTIDKNNFFNIVDIFISYREEIKNKLPWYIRWFSDCEF